MGYLGLRVRLTPHNGRGLEVACLHADAVYDCTLNGLPNGEFDEQFLMDVWEDVVFDGKDNISLSVAEGTLRQLYEDLQSKGNFGVHPRNVVDDGYSFAASMLEDCAAIYPNLVLIPGVGLVTGNLQDISRVLYAQTMGWKFDYCVVSLEDGQWTVMLLTEGEQTLLGNVEYVQKLGDKIGELV